MDGAQREMIVERILDLGIVSATAAIQASIVAVFFTGKRPREVYDNATIVPMLFRGMAGMVVLVVLFAIYGGTVPMASLGGAAIMIVLLFMLWQFPLGLGRALHRHGALTLPILSAIFAWTVFLLIYWIRATG